MITGTVHQISLEVAAPHNAWEYDASGALYAIPGTIASIDYEADGQTRKIVYANGRAAGLPQANSSCRWHDERPANAGTLPQAAWTRPGWWERRSPSL
jgi:hypothetical protein